MTKSATGSARPPVFNFLIVAALGAGAIVGAAIMGAKRWKARHGQNTDAHDPDAPAAYTHPVNDDNFNKTRDAGPEHMRDLDEKDGWDVVDENSDESFPASDPPGNY